MLSLDVYRVGPSIAQIACVAWLVAIGACDVYDPSRASPLASEDGGDMGSREGEGEGAADGGSEPPCARATGGSRSSAPCPPSPGRPGCQESCDAGDEDCDRRAREGSADSSCDAPHADTICQDGACLIVGCRDGFRDCDQKPETGCEVEADDVNNCGACGHVCEAANAQAVCRAGRCVVDACKPGFADCDGDRSSCETSLDTVKNCGVCGVACSAGPNASSRCDRGECTPAVCDPGFADCNGDSADGCEQSLDTLEHCGSCGVRCAKATCNGGVCTAAECSPSSGTADCDGDELSCETAVRDNVDHCGACGKRCELGGETAHAHAVCIGVECRSMCDPGFADCDYQAANGCERATTTLSDCGSCGQTCTIPDASEICSQGRCEVQACNPDFADCDGDRRSCETTLNTNENCGHCGRRCRLPHALTRCEGSPGDRSCALAGCESGWADCDGDEANGCERNARGLIEGGLGPCLPEPNCTRSTRDGHEYYVCPTARSWSAARANCQTQVRGDLAVVESAGEASYLASLLRSRHWIGHSDLNREGLWAWAPTGVPFWRGEWRGDPVGSAYAHWARREPNGSGDCGAIFEDGLLDDLSCSTNEPYICEVSPDRCPEDFAKIDPGQCGCGRLDTDRDGDGFAECARAD